MYAFENYPYITIYKTKLYFVTYKNMTLKCFLAMYEKKKKNLSKITEPDSCRLVIQLLVGLRILQNSLLHQDNTYYMKHFIYVDQASQKN